MHKKNAPGKLQLSRETLRTLDARGLTRAVGGVTSTCKSYISCLTVTRPE